MINMSVSMQTSLSNIQIQPLSPAEQERIIQDSFNQLGEISSQNLNEFLNQLNIVVKNFLNEYEIAWSSFNSSFNLENSINMSSQKKSTAYYNLRKQQGSIGTAENFIRVLEKGNLLLEHIRKMITTQIIETNFTVKGSANEVYMVDKKSVPYSLVLSTYGSSGNNFVSLAYSIDVKGLIDDLRAQNTDKGQKLLISDTDIYTRIMQVKDQYLDDYRAKNPGRKYISYFDSKDAEIFDLLSQRLERQEISVLNLALTKATYYKMRKSMGGGGGYRTSSTQLGDVGLKQDKLISLQQQQVNFARQTLIYNRFQQLSQSLNSNDKQQIKNTFLMLFTEKQQRVSDSVSKMSNKEARQIINNLFK